MRYLIVLVMAISACSKPSSEEPAGPSISPVEKSCPAWGYPNLHSPNWLVLELGQASGSATDVTQCADGCGTAYYLGKIYTGCN